ncbi:tRNA-splicing endonuclease subunit Sen34 [Aplysia californica]|uniref:tRNA-intron lyase n=1 Tax=Aplysia californica TaxID=6500 RepID=A0ABM0ZZ01_APLCA|nr:tRNA-splicing endonuclease subunit Sen34 [Aplysia californica]
MEEAQKSEDELLGLGTLESDVLQIAGGEIKGVELVATDENLEDIEAELLLLSSPAPGQEKPKPGTSLKSALEVIDDDELEILDDSGSDVMETDDLSEDSNGFIDGKISIFCCQGCLFVWNAEDAQMLREECRVVGKLSGCLPRAPRQNNHLGLPLQLMPEEARLLVDIDAAVVVEEVETSSKVQKAREKAFKTVREENFKIQQQLYKECRKEEVQHRMSDIIAGKKAKKRKLQKEASEKESAGAGAEEEGSERTHPGQSNERTQAGGSDNVEENTEEDNLTADDIVNSETSIKHSLVQIFTENPWKRSLQPASSWNFPTTDKDILRYAVFKDLWKKGYYLTSGAKFGGDFLVYPGDPARFHSHYIAVCMEQHQEIPVLDVISMGRLASNVRKTTILCSITRRNKVVYTSLQWTGIS